MHLFAAAAPCHRVSVHMTAQTQEVVEVVVAAALTADVVGGGVMAVAVMLVKGGACHKCGETGLLASSCLNEFSTTFALAALISTPVDR